LADARNTSGDVLIVEDDAGFARLLEAELANHSLSAVRVASAEEALDQLEVEKPKAVVLDLLLPGLQGEVFLKRLRDGNGADVPVIVVTVKDLSLEERAALDKLGVVAMLRKEPAVGVVASELIQEMVRGDARVRGRQGLAA
jgi:DNA-binding response OmpR family regulator